MGRKQEAPNRWYTDEFRLEAVRLAESVGSNEAAKRLGIPQATMRNWFRRWKAEGLPTAITPAAPVKRGVDELAAENERLRRELANAKADLEIVKKAAAYFAKESR